MYLSDFEYLHLFQKYFLPKFEVFRNQAKFCMFFQCQPLPTEIFNRHYKIWPGADHLTKFCANRLMHLGDLALKK